MVFRRLDRVYRITVAKTITLSPHIFADIQREVLGVDALDEYMGVYWNQRYKHKEMQVFV